MSRAGAVTTAELERANTTYRAQQSVVAARMKEVSAAEADFASAQSVSRAVAATFRSQLAMAVHSDCLARTALARARLLHADNARARDELPNCLAW